MLEGNAIYANAQAGVAVESGAAPTLRRNRLHGGRHAGLLLLPYRPAAHIQSLADIFAFAKCNKETEKTADHTRKKYTGGVW